MASLDKYLYLKARAKILRPGTPSALEAAERLIEHCASEYKNGNTLMLFHAVELCAEFDIPPAEWIRAGMKEAIKSLTQYKSKSLDQAFGFEIPKGLNLNAKREKKRLEVPVYLRVLKLKTEMPVDDYLFEKVGKEFGISSGKAKQFHYNVIRFMKIAGNDKEWQQLSRLTYKANAVALRRKVWRHWAPPPKQK